MVEGKYYLQLIDVRNDLSLDTYEYYANETSMFGKFLLRLFNTSSKMAIIGDDGKIIDYAEFFRKNDSQTLFTGVQVTPSSCDKL